jgi:hypothetical protein
VAAAVWLVLAQALGFATGGYLAGRLRSPAYDGVPGETLFRDAAEGFVVWSIGAVTMASTVVVTTWFAASTAAQTVNNTTSAAMARNAPEGAPAAGAGTATDYYVDLLLRPDPTALAGQRAPRSNNATVGTATPPSAPNNEVRAEAERVLLHGLTQGKLDDNDRTYLAQLVSARAGLPPDQAQSRVSEVEAKAREAIKEAADQAAKTGAYVSFWTFMSLLFGGAAATLAAVLGGQLRDAEGRPVAAG